MMRWILFLAAVAAVQATLPDVSPYTWRCAPSVRVKDSKHQGKQQNAGEPVCVRHIRLPENATEIPQDMNMNECRLTCGKFGVLWPKPNHVEMGKKVVHFVPKDLHFKLPATQQEVATLLGKGIEVFVENLMRNHPRFDAEAPSRRNSDFLFASRAATHDVIVTINVTEQRPTYLTLNTSVEAYKLQVNSPAPHNSILVYIEAESYFGIRNGLETLSQLIAYDDAENNLMIVNHASITDEPAYAYRGLLLDTSRNYISIKEIKHQIDAMAASKLNTFHWHITDSHSFPMQLQSLPEMSAYGAYEPHKIYTAADIKDIVEYARVRGVRVLPEFDAPAHVGSGWQWGPSRQLGELAVCVNQEPWQSFCVEPPCGQLNIANPQIYEVLQKLYNDMVESFKPLDLFHYGGDEVNLNCWNSTEQIKKWMLETAKQPDLSADSYYKEWNIFQEKARLALTKANGQVEVPGILWTSHLTEKGRAAQFLDPLKYIIQIWTTGEDPLIKELLDNKFRLIFSNYDALYLDCGFSAWVGNGTNWCSPYKGWQKVYDNNPLQISRNLTQGVLQENLIQGGEAAMWTEQVDDHNLASKVWPRAAALAERLWSMPSHGWELAEHRMIYHRQRLVERGVNAERLQPEWCLQNQDLCYINKE